MEGVPLVPAEDPEQSRFDGTAESDSKKDKKKKSAGAAALRTGVELTSTRDNETERRDTTTTTIANLSIAEAFGTKPKAKEEKTEENDVSTESLGEHLSEQMADDTIQSDVGVTQEQSAANVPEVVELEVSGAPEFTTQHSSPKVEEAYNDVLKQYALSQDAVTSEPITVAEGIPSREDPPMQDSSEQLQVSVDLDGEQDAIVTKHDNVDEEPEQKIDDPQQLVDDLSDDLSAGTPSSASPAQSPTPAPSSGGHRPILPSPPVVLSQAVSPQQPTSPIPDIPRTPSIQNVASPANTSNERSSRAAERRNSLVIGLAIGSLYEHFKHKKQEAALKKTVEQNGKQITEMNKAHRQTTEDLLKRKNTVAVDTLASSKYDAPSAEIPKMVIQSETRSIIVPTSATERQVPSIEHPPTPLGSSIDERKKPREAPRTAMGERKIATSFEQRQPFTHSPGERLGTIANQEQIDANKRNEVIIVEDEPIAVADDRRVETSSWHRIEIDKATGKAVEDPTIAYGEAYQQERHQELSSQTAPTNKNTQTENNESDPGVGSVSSQQRQVAPASVLITHQTGQNQQQLATTNQIEETKRIANANNVDTASIGLWTVFVLLVAATIFVLVR